jgi:hypothetical protein
MLNKINDIKKALRAEAFLSALALTLTLPDICGKVAYPKLGCGERYKRWYDENIAKFERRATCTFPVSNGETPYCINPEGTKTCSENTDPLQCSFYVNKGNKLFTAEMCWALRCAFLHSGSIEGIEGKYIDEFELQITRLNEWSETGGAHGFGVHWFDGDASKQYHIRLDVAHFCYTVYTAAEYFHEDNKDNLDFNDAHVTLFDLDKWVELHKPFSE